MTDTLESFDWDIFDNIQSEPENSDFYRKRCGGIGASQIYSICTNRPDYSKIPELETAITELSDKIESSKTGRTITAEKELATKQRQLDAILNDQLPEGAKKLAIKKALERITGFCEESDVSFDSPATRWGNKYEAEAIEALKEAYPEIEFLHTGEEQHRFQFDDYEHVKATPDAVLRAAGCMFATLDIKCPFERINHRDNMKLTDWNSFMSLHPDYAYQGICQMIAAKVNNFWFVSYDPRAKGTILPALVVHKFELNPADAEFMRSRVAMFEAAVQDEIESLKGE